MNGNTEVRNPLVDLRLHFITKNDFVDVLDQLNGKMK